jgi:hypothetical protein
MGRIEHKMGKTEKKERIKLFNLNIFIFFLINKVKSLLIKKAQDLKS